MDVNDANCVMLISRGPTGKNSKLLTQQVTKIRIRAWVTDLIVSCDFAVTRSKMYRSGESSSCSAWA